MSTLKLKPKSGLYAASNVTLDPNTLEARSYEHWTFSRLIKGQLVFNGHRYSNTTSRHQWRVKQTLATLGHKPDLEVDTHLSLSREDALIDSIGNLKAHILKLQHEIEKPRSNPRKNAERLNEIQACRNKIKQIKKLL